MNMTLHELGFATSILCFGAVIGGWIVYRHVEWVMRHLAREYVPSKPVYVPDRREEFTEADREELSRKVSFRDADTLTVFEGMSRAAEPETVQITDAAPTVPWTNSRGTVIHPRRGNGRGLIQHPLLDEPREPDAVIPPGEVPPPFTPDLPDLRAASADWDAIASLGGLTPEEAAANLAVKHFGQDYSKPALAGRSRDSRGRFATAGSPA